MAIHFYEGLPGSGKSYEAMVNYIIPKLKEGRRGRVNIKGLNFEQISEIAEIPQEKLKTQLHQIEWYDTLLIPQNVKSNPEFWQDSFVVIDELQDFWIQSRSPLDPVTTEFITQHRHWGIDILCMGQSIKDIHTIWRRRVSLKLFFLNLEAIGRPTNYKWECWAQVRPDEWEQTTSGGSAYDQKYFGTYKSHNIGVDNKTQTVDKRNNILNTRFFKLWLPLAVIAAIAGVFYMYKLFTDPTMMFGDKLKPKDQSKIVKVDNNKVHIQQNTQKPSVISKAQTQLPSTSQDKVIYRPQSFNHLLENHQIIYFGHYTLKAKIKPIFALLDDSGQQIVRLTDNDLADLGYQITTIATGVYSIKSTKSNFETYITKNGFNQQKGVHNEN